MIMETNRKSLVSEITALYKAMIPLPENMYPYTIRVYHNTIGRNIELLHGLWFSSSRRELYKTLEGYPNAKRPIKELLLLLLKQIYDLNIITGLCHTINSMKYFYIISLEERIILLDYIYENRPFGIVGDRIAGYWWTEGDKPPRIYFVNELIHALS